MQIIKNAYNAYKTTTYENPINKKTIIVNELYRALLAVARRFMKKLEPLFNDLKAKITIITTKIIIIFMFNMKKLMQNMKMIIKTLCSQLKNIIKKKLQNIITMLVSTFETNIILPFYKLLLQFIKDPIITTINMLLLIYIFFYDSYNWIFDLITKMRTKYFFYKNWKRPEGKPQKWHPLKQDIVNFIRFRILHKIMTRETFMVLLYIFLGFVILFWFIFFRVKYLVELIKEIAEITQLIAIRHWAKMKNTHSKKIAQYSNVKVGACERILRYQPKQKKRVTRDFRRNTFFTNNKPDTNADTNKTNKSWKQLLILRLCVFFGLLIVLIFSYLFSESYDINKIHRLLTMFLNDEDWSKTTKLITRCWHDYINIWNYKQWTVSILGIIPAYWVLFDLLFWVKLIDKPFTPSQKIFFIGTDLFLNLVVGLVYMAYPHNVIGALMYKCPVALSPYFIIIEITMYLLFRAWLKYRENKISSKP